MKKIWLLFIFLLVFFGVLALARGTIARMVITKAAKSATGLDLRVRKVNIAITKPVIRLEGLSILNPPGFNEEVLADLPEIQIDYDLKAFLTGWAHLRRIKVHLNTLNVVMNERGEANINSLKPLRAKPEAKKPDEKKHTRVRIDELWLVVNKVVYKSFVLGRQDTREFNIDLDERIKDINDVNALVSLVLLKALGKTNLSGIANINLKVLDENINRFKGQFKDEAEGLRKRAGEIIGDGQEKLRNIFQPKE